LPADDDNKIALNALSYGDYVIDIRYLNEKGEFVEGAIGVSLEILPFWYQTWWFRLLVFIFSLSIIFFIVRLIYVSRYEDSGWRWKNNLPYRLNAKEFLQRCMMILEQDYQVLNYSPR
jgi:hypothetical protein